MKHTNSLYLFICLLIPLCFVGCKNDLSTTGSEVLPTEDAILVNVDTFAVRSAIVRAGEIYSSPDSLLLGEAVNRFGTIHADLLTQLVCPIGFEYPENSSVDSVCVFVYYNSYYGDGNSPMQVSVYEMDKSTFDFTTGYRTTLPLDDYWSGDEATQIGNSRIFTAAMPTDSIYSSTTETYIPFLRFKAGVQFADKFFAIRDFSSQEAFNNIFKGLYISSDFGSATVLNVSEVGLAVYYNFTYNLEGRDTTVQDAKLFYSNAEVRKVNRLDYHIPDADYNALKAVQDDTTFVVSPAHIYTELKLPMKQMSSDIVSGLNNKRPYVNRARLRADVLNVYRGQSSARTPNDWPQPANYMMLCLADSLQRLFDDNAAPVSTVALISTLTTAYDSLGNPYDYYEYDLADLLTEQIRKTEEEVPDTLSMLLVPVTVSTATAQTGATYYTSVHPDQTITATTLRSAQTKAAPLNIEVTASGF